MAIGNVSQKYRKLFKDYKDEITQNSDPKNPKRLREYRLAYFTNQKLVVAMAEEQPLILAHAMHGKFKFTDHVNLARTAEGKKIPWELMRGCLQIHQSAKELLNALVAENLTDSLIKAVTLNYLLENETKFQTANQEELVGDLLAAQTEHEFAEIQGEDNE